MEKIIGVVFIGTGLLFFFDNNKISKGAFWFYQKIYTEDNLKIIFKVLGAILLFAGSALMFLEY